MKELKLNFSELQELVDAYKKGMASTLALKPENIKLVALNLIFVDEETELRGEHILRSPDYNPEDYE